MSASASCAPVSMASAPAMSDRTKPSAMPIVSAMARISSASVTIVPVKPRCSRSSPVVIGRLTVAGDSASNAGTSRCPVMIARAPAAIPARNGASSSASSSSRSLVTVGSSWCESAVVAPWPGKCFGHAATPAACTPRTAAATWRAATCRIGAERTDADHRISWIEVDVRNRGEVDRDPSTRQPPPDCRVHRFSGCRVVERTERGGARSRTAHPRVESGHVTALLVQRHNDIAPGCIPKRPRQCPDLRAVADIRAEQNDAAEAVGQSLSEPQRRHRPGETGQQAAECEPSDIGQRRAPLLKWTRQICIVQVWPGSVNGVDILHPGNAAVRQGARRREHP